MSPKEQAPSDATRRLGKGAAVLSVGIASAGLFTYLFFAVASHTLSRSEYGSITLLWSAVFIIVSVLYRPVEQLLSRTIAERQALGLQDLGPLRVAAKIQLALGAAFAVAALIFRGPIESGLFSGDSTLYWILIVAILAYAASYFARGYLAGQRRFGLYGALVTFESTSRLLFAIAFAVGIATSHSVPAAGIAAAPLISLAVLPWAIGHHLRRNGQGRETVGYAQDRVEASPEKFSLAHGGRFAAAVLIIMFSEQTLLNAGPLAVKATAGTAGVALAGFAFNILLIARAPLQLFQAVSTSILPHLTNVRVTEGADAFRRSVRITLLAVVGFATLVVLVMATIGPQLMHIFFSKKFDYDRWGLVLVAVGMGLYLSATTLNQAALAQGQARRAATCWLTTAALFVAWLFMPVLGEVRRVEVGYVVAAGLLYGLLYIVYRRPVEHPEDVPTPGSVEELEAQLASADEAT